MSRSTSLARAVKAAPLLPSSVQRPQTCLCYMCVCLELLYTAGHTTLAGQGKITLSDVLAGIAWLILVIGLPSQFCLLAPQHIPEIV